MMKSDLTKKYLRFGEISQNERSINFLKLSFSENESFTYNLENYGIDKAIQYVPKTALELGVSVFEMGENGLPVLHNMREVFSLAGRIGRKVFEVSGDEVGRGNDGEPLIVNINILKTRRIKEEKLVNHIISFLCSNFMHVIPPVTEYEGDYMIYEHYLRNQINIKTKEIKSILIGVDNGFVKIPGHEYFTFAGWEFHFPMNGFDSSTGIRE